MHALRVSAPTPQVQRVEADVSQPAASTTTRRRVTIEFKAGHKQVLSPLQQQVPPSLALTGRQSHLG